MSVQIPGKVIDVNVTTILGLEAWPYDDGTGDPWYANGNPYRWQIVFTVAGESHSSHITRKPYIWDGLDITAGDWIAGKNNPLALKIIEVENKSSTTVTAIVEDIDRFNTFNDSTGNGIGIFPSGEAIVFEVGDDGLPILNPLPFGVPANFVADLTSRFRIQNPNFRYRFTEEAHSFEIGEEVAITSGGWVKASLTDDRVVGSVTDIGPGPNIFFLNPRTKIVEKHFPALPGSVGDYVYIDDTSPGDLDNIPTGNPVFLKLTEAIPSTIRGTVANPTVTIGNKLEINDTPVTFTGATLTDVVDDINALTSTHGIVASEAFVETITIGTISGPWTEITPPVEFSLNGNSVFLTTDNQFAGYSLLQDMIDDINAETGTHGMLASDASGYLKIENPSGGPITIVDLDPAVPTGGNRKSFTEATGLSSVAASTDKILFLQADDGREIILQDIIGTPLADLGIYSVDNGKLPLGLVMEKGVQKGEMYVVPDIPARNALVPQVGDQAFVEDTGEGEWALYVWVSSLVWVQMANQDSARTDAETASIDISWNSPSSNFIFRVSDGSRVSFVTTEVTEAFNGASPTLTVGDTGDNERLMTEDMNDLTAVDTYASTPSYQYDTGGTETEIYVYFASNGSSQGSAKITITYA